MLACAVMALAKCRECGRDCAKTASVCPGCGVANPVRHWTLGAKLGAVLLALVALKFCVFRSSSTDSAGEQVAAAIAAPGMDSITRKVATDAVAQYEMAKRQGDQIQTCVQAGFVSAAWLQAKDEPKYIAAKAQEKADCAKAGMPRP